MMRCNQGRQEEKDHIKLTHYIASFNPVFITELVHQRPSLALSYSNLIYCLKFSLHFRSRSILIAFDRWVIMSHQLSPFFFSLLFFLKRQTQLLSLSLSLSRLKSITDAENSPFSERSYLIIE